MLNYPWIWETKLGTTPKMERIGTLALVTQPTLSSLLFRSGTPKQLSLQQNMMLRLSPGPGQATFTHFCQILVLRLWLLPMLVILISYTKLQVTLVFFIPRSQFKIHNQTLRLSGVLKASDSTPPLNILFRPNHMTWRCKFSCQT